MCVCVRTSATLLTRAASLSHEPFHCNGHAQQIHSDFVSGSDASAPENLVRKMALKLSQLQLQRWKGK